MYRQQTDSAVASDIMVPVQKLVVLKPDMDALTAVRMLIRKKISGAPVVDEDNRYLGVFSEKTSMQFLLRLTYDALPSSDVRSFMNTETERTIDPNTGLLSIMEMFLLTPYRRLPVLSGEFLVGQISRRDALAVATKSLEETVHRQGKQPLYLSALVAYEDRDSRF